jgi:hypothetical protein
MTAIHPQFITDNDGNKISAVISMGEFNAIMEELEDIEDVKLYDEAKKEDSGERILFSDYVKNRKEKNA